MKKRIKSLIELIRHGNSLNAERATHIRVTLLEIHDSLDNFEEISILESLHLIIKNQDKIMDQNATISTALDNLTNVVNEAVKELQAIAVGIQPGMTDDQAQALADRANALATALGAVEKPATASL